MRRSDRPVAVSVLYLSDPAEGCFADSVGPADYFCPAYCPDYVGLRSASDPVYPDSDPGSAVGCPDFDSGLDSCPVPAFSVGQAAGSL